LTSRKYGVATVWLVATLGSRSSLKKVNRKAILSVDVTKACETILQPEAPMALRLQSNLLYGLSRVYSEQVSYILTDAQHTQNNIRAMLKIVRTAELDTEAGRTRPDQLLLEDDPSYLPDFAIAPLDFDLSNLDIGAENLSSIGSSQRSRRSVSLKEQYGGRVGGLVLTSSDSHSLGGGYTGGFSVQGDEGRGSALNVQDDDGFMPEADFAFDAEGNLLELAPVQRPHPSTPGIDVGPGIPTGSAVADRVGAEMDIDIPIADDMDLLLPEEPAFPSAHDRPTSPFGTGPVDEPTITAPQRRQRKIRALAVDERMELRNADLADWINNYTEKMNEAAQHKQIMKVNAQAKRNAEFWVLGSGLGGIGHRAGEAELPGPLDIFQGQALLRSLGIERGVAGLKRSASQGADEITNEGARRVRQRTASSEAARGQAQAEMENDGFANIDDMDVEMPREGPEDMDEHHLSSAMPWNITASVRGSSVPHSGQPGLGLGSIGAAATTSVGGPSSLGRRGSRMVSASPLLGRSRPGGLEPLHSLTSDAAGADDTLGGFAAEDMVVGGVGADDDFEMYGPAAAVDTQTAGDSQWLRGALAKESDNFFLFIQDELEKKGDTADEVVFGEMLPPASNSHVVAAQALLHVLTLATAGAIGVRQDKPFEEIGIRVVRVEG
ncbi:hypothetical protein K490DRAFT_51799, partial [Saccharata proteae CBS 121410]